MPEDFENMPNYLGKQAVVISTGEVEMMYGSCEAAVSMAQHAIDAAREHDDAQGVVAFTMLEFGLKECTKYFKHMMDVVEKLKDERKAEEPDLNELNDKDREN